MRICAVGTFTTRHVTPWGVKLHSLLPRRRRQNSRRSAPSFCCQRAHHGHDAFRILSTRVTFFSTRFLVRFLVRFLGAFLGSAIAALAVRVALVCRLARIEITRRSQPSRDGTSARWSLRARPSGPARMRGERLGCREDARGYCARPSSWSMEVERGERCSAVVATPYLWHSMPSGNLVSVRANSARGGFPDGAARRQTRR